jgi:predicted SAM-dependent methyltransferase
MFEDDSIDVIEAHHMIEHLSFADTEKALQEWYRVLRPKGILVITCPNLTRLCVKWLKYSMLNHIIPCPKKIDYLVKMFVGQQKNEGLFHKNVFDSVRLSNVLSRHGFVVEFRFTPFPQRPTPSMLIIARKSKCDSC